MILTCPNCTARFIVDPTALGPQGRTVRCARCRETWHAHASNDDMGRAVSFAESFPDQSTEPASATSAAESSPPASVWGSYANESVPSFLSETYRQPPISGRRPSLPAVQKPKRNTARNIAWLVIGVLTVALLVLLAVGRERVVALWPSTAPIYAAFGMQTPVLGTGLDLEGIHTELVPIDGKTTLIVMGRVVNISTVPQKVPPLTITLRDTKDAPVKSWSINPSQGRLLPGEGMSFQGSMISPPENLGSALVTFGAK